MLDGVYDGKDSSTMLQIERGDQIRLKLNAGYRALVIEHRLGAWIVADSSQVGTPKAKIKSAARLTFMSTEGQVLRVLVLSVSTNSDNGRHSTLLLPLDDIGYRINYVLIDRELNDVQDQFEELFCAPFFEGAKILMGCGQRKPVENVRIGDVLQTTTNGKVSVEWCGKRLLAATGSNAPIFVEKGEIGNDSSLILSPRSKIFSSGKHPYRRGGQFVSAANLVNGCTVRWLPDQYITHFYIRIKQPSFIIANDSQISTFPAPGVLSLRDLTSCG
ncbi:Hint domain-containing protein [Palleronia caenipelagi]|nr:Hint domain-containing protein [Palleronia caenipelagi]